MLASFPPVRSTPGDLRRRAIHDSTNKLETFPFAAILGPLTQIASRWPTFSSIDAGHANYES